MAAGILRAAPRTEAELEARLVAKGYQRATAAAAVARCRELGWVGDERLAHDRARTLRLRGAGSLKIAADLAARGLPAEVIAPAVEASLDGESERAWAERALARVRRADGAAAEGADRDRVAAWRLLVARGFPEDVVVALLGWLE